MFRAAASSALVVSGLIALSACASSGPVQSAQTLPEVRVSQPHLVAVPDSVRISARYTEKFSTPLPTDPQQAAVISGFRESEVLWDQSSEGLRLTAATPEWVTGAALTKLRKLVQSYASGNIVPVGVDRLYDTKITSLAASTATVTSCDDGTAFNIADRATGRTPAPVPVSQQYAFGVFGMRLVAGRWTLSSLTGVGYPDQRVKACMQAA
ncbi:MAG TPA: hypothetical protein VH589_20260 [Trebonia sp.]